MTCMWKYHLISFLFSTAQIGGTESRKTDLYFDYFIPFYAELSFLLREFSV